MRITRAVLVVLTGAMMGWAAVTGLIQGRVVDPSGGVIPGAHITATDVATGAVLRAVTGANGSFQLTGKAGHTYAIRVTYDGFQAVQRRVTVVAGQPAVLNVQLTVRGVSQTVMVRAGGVKGATTAPTQQQVFQSTQSVRVLDREQINSLSPVAGAAQILSVAPGVNVTGFGSTGATKSTITLNGVQQGWGGYGGFTTAGDLGITFDGIPVADAATGLWQSNMFPQSALINSSSVTYGPGDPANRWYNNVAGGVEFTPLQPTNHPHFSLTQTFGNYAQENTAFEATTGLYRGWSAVFAAGHGTGDSYRVGPDGFANPGRDYAGYGKLIKNFDAGDISFGGYYSDAVAYRPQVIPTTAVAGVTIDGTPNGALYSQQTSGFYSTAPFAAYEKHDFNQMALFWSRLNLNVDPTTLVQNEVWFERINRLHDRNNDVFNLGSQVAEWNNPFTKTYGERFTIQKILPAHNTVTAGAWYMHTLYNSRNLFYNPADGGSSGDVANIGAKLRDSYFGQDMYTVFAQDQFSPVDWLTLTPGIRYLDNQIAYTNGDLHDFAFVPGAVLNDSCALNGNSFAINPDGTPSTATPNVKIQNSFCDAVENRGGYEPSFDLAIRPFSWLSLYGGYQTELRTPALGGGGGMFQGVDPRSYTLATAEYSQAGVKLHFNQVGPMNAFLTGISYFHLLFKNQELDTTLGNGDTIYANASSRYNGVDWYLDANPTSHLHVFTNSTFERTLYSDWNQGGTDFSGLMVPYVPNTIMNIGAYYTIPVNEQMVVQPRVWYQFTGSQTIFNNNAGAPSSTTMPSFGTVNLGANIPVKFLNFRVTALNIFNKQYNQYEWISSGGYLGGTPGYMLAYPGAPFEIYGSVSVHF